MATRKKAARKKSARRVKTNDHGIDWGKEVPATEPTQIQGFTLPPKRERHPPPLVQQIQEECLTRRGWHKFEKSTTLRIRAVCRALCEGDKEKADDLYVTLDRKELRYWVAPDTGVIHAIEEESPRTLCNMKPTPEGQEGAWEPTKKKPDCPRCLKRTNVDHPLKAQALERVEPFILAQHASQLRRKEAEKKIEKLAKMLPVWTAYVENLPGLGAKGLGLIIGEAGDLNDFERPTQLWTWMGVGLIPLEGPADPNPMIQRRCAGDMGLIHRYNPERRSVLFTIGEALYKTEGPYRQMYLERKEYEREKAKSEGLTVCPAAQIPKGEESKYRSDGHIHNRARRYAEKQLLKNLLHKWHECGKIPTA